MSDVFAIQADLAGSLEEAAVDAVANQSDFQWVEPVRMYYHASSGFYFDDVSVNQLLWRISKLLE